MKPILYIDENPELTKALESLGIKYDSITSPEIVFINKDNKERIVFKDRDIRLDDYSGVVFLPSESHNFKLTTFLTENKVKGIYNTMDAINKAKSKLWSYEAFKNAGIRIPLTITFNKNHITLNQLKTILDENFKTNTYLIKPNNSSWGFGVCVCHSANEIITRTKAMKPNDPIWFIQEYISPGKRIDERHMVFNNEVVNSAYKIGKEGTIATNIYLGGSWGVMPEIDNETREMCIKAHKASGLTYSGVDIIRDEQGTPYVLEINDSPSCSICEGVGKNHYSKITEYIKKNWK